ncbi:helix-hairpin-helix domain-containing protein [Stenotrophomonas sp. ATCM1_4]|uniref:helix-hairpin-helix domain-containing protein n=1 Tax=Stenotrophomonas sp. ATCM1_4 TaxID=2259330 RepID=UPI00104B3710|nr:helix-hairpin-helix domain-containing protein [Stenotrophomonas sp. ATCM1_4]TDB28246.1 helix-hairpin-helix domain-containing protein [Stenotrophomonas sp. ATCM1_4]
MAVEGFSAEERAVLLAVKGVGATVVARLEQLGFHSLAQLADAETMDIVTQASAMLGSSCWRNSPQARAAISGAIDAARKAR